MFKNHGMNMKTSMATLALILAVAFSSPLPSWAAMSGGRMGGSFSSSPSPSRSSSSYSRGYSSGYRSGYRSSRPSVIVSPTPYYSAPYISPISPFTAMRPYGYGGPGIITYSRGPSFFDLLFLGGIIFAISTAFRSNASEMMSNTGEGISSLWDGSASGSALGPGRSVLKISVAMDVPNRDSPDSILSTLNRLANTAKTDSRVGIQNLSSQVALELLRRKSSITSASAQYNHYNNFDKAQRDYNSMSVKERSKFEKETVSKYGGVDYTSGNNRNRLSQQDIQDKDKATMAVVTMVISIDGDSTKIPSTIRSIKDVEDALQKIASDTKVDDCLQSVEILWTPEDRDETLSSRDVIVDYPDLRTI